MKKTDWAGVPAGKRAAGPNHLWAEKLPQEEDGAREPRTYCWDGEREEEYYIDAREHLEKMEPDEDRKFIRDCTLRLSAYISALVLQELRNGITNTPIGRLTTLGNEQRPMGFRPFSWAPNRR